MPKARYSLDVRPIVFSRRADPSVGDLYLHFHQRMDRAHDVDVAALVERDGGRVSGQLRTEIEVVARARGEDVVRDVVVVHNIFSSSPGNDFNLGSQLPGNSTSVTFDKSGDVDVMCAIHPLMKMKVKVAD